MASVWAEGLRHSLEQTLDQLASAVRDCPNDLWTAPMWPTSALPPEHQFLRADWTPVSDPAERAALAARWVERRSTPWSVAWHALETLDYDLTAEFGAWSPPPPFAGHPHWRDLPRVPGAWSPLEILRYVEHCRERVSRTFEEMTDDLGAKLLPPAHRYHGQPHAWLLTGLPAHTAEHAAHIRQFSSAAPILPGH